MQTSSVAVVQSSSSYSSGSYLVFWVQTFLIVGLQIVTSAPYGMKSVTLWQSLQIGTGFEFCEFSLGSDYVWSSDFSLKVFVLTTLLHLRRPLASPCGKFPRQHSGNRPGPVKGVRV